MLTWQITIDGPAASGKTCIGKWLANKLQCLYIDTGIHYRAFTWWCLYDKVNIDDIEELQDAIDKFTCTFYGKDYVINGELVNPIALETPDITTIIGKLAAKKNVRAKLTSIQRQLAQKTNSIMVGRDAGTVILPTAICKLFITASVDVRAERRYKQDIDNGLDVELPEIKAKIIARDYADTHRTLSPLKPASDAIVLDNSKLTLVENKQAVLKIVKSKIKELE